ncbi:hypothetical protein STEG23_028322 [Scotinomys teguina]
MGGRGSGPEPGSKGEEASLPRRRQDVAITYESSFVCVTHRSAETLNARNPIDTTLAYDPEWITATKE